MTIDRSAAATAQRRRVRLMNVAFGAGQEPETWPPGGFTVARGRTLASRC